jgi:hypothetical protein
MEKLMSLSKNEVAIQSTLVTRYYSMFPAEDLVVTDHKSLIKEELSKKGNPPGRLWRVASPFNVWIWEELKPINSTTNNNSTVWETYFDNYPKSSEGYCIGELVYLQTHNKKRGDFLKDYEQPLINWLYQDVVLSEEDKVERWQERINLAEHTIISSGSKYVLIGETLPNQAIVLFLLQRAFFDEVDKKTMAIMTQTSDKLEDEFKLTPKRLYKNQLYEKISTEVSALQLKFELSIASLFTPSKFFSSLREEKFYKSLVKSFNIEDEVEGLSDRIETLADIYLVTGERITEYRYFLGEVVLEVTIIVTLLVEIYLMYEK